MELVLLRHGESEWNRLNLFTGWTDVPLSQKGKIEARSAGEWLAKEGYDFDICYTSLLKRAIHTLNIALEKMDRDWLPVEKTWLLNERHYGALQGLNKKETAEKYGEEQVEVWRRSYDVPPPPLKESDQRNPRLQSQYRDVAEKLPLEETLKDTVDRVVPYFTKVIAPELLAGKRVMIVAHGNSLRALMMYLEGMTPEEITKVNLPTGIPLVYKLNKKLQFEGKKYLGDPDDIAAKVLAVANQGKK